MKKIILPFLLTTALLFAADYNSIVAGGETQYEVVKEKVTKIVHTEIPVGGSIATTSNRERIFISSVSSDEISIGYGKDVSNGRSSTNTTAHFGRCKLNSEIITRFNNSTPALRIKLIAVDMEHGTCTLIVTKFWPCPNDPKTKEVDPPTNPEAMPVK